MVLACCPLLKVSNEKTCIVWAHLTAHGDPYDLLVKISVTGKRIEGQHKFSRTGECACRWVENWTHV